MKRRWFQDERRENGLTQARASLRQIMPGCSLAQVEECFVFLFTESQLQQL